MNQQGGAVAADRQSHSISVFRSQVAKSLGVRVIAAGLTFSIGPLCARAIGQDGFGEYVVAIFWTNVLVIVGKLGLDTTSLRFVAHYRSQGETGLLHRFVVMSRRCTLVTSVVAAMLLAAVTFGLRDSMDEGVFQCLLLASLLLPVIVGIQLREAGLLAFGRIISGQLNSMLTPLLLITTILASSLLMGLQLTSQTIVLLHLSSAVLTLACLRWLTRNMMPEFQGPDSGDVHRTEWMQVALPLLLVQLLNLLQNQGGTGMSGALLGKEGAALFGAAARVAGVLFLGLQAINTIAAPTISSLFHSGRIVELEQYVRRCALASFGFAGCFALVMLVCGRFVLGLFGDVFVAGYVPMLVVLSGLAIASAAGPVTQLMLMTGRQWDCIGIFAANVAVCLTLGWFIIPVYGVLGAAIMAVVARVGSTVSLVLVARFRHGLWCVVGLSVAPGETSVRPTRAAA